MSSSEPRSSSHSSWSSDSSSAWDDWPPDFDGTGLFESLKRDEPPVFRFDVRTVLGEVEEHVGSKVVDIPLVGKGSNYFGMHLRLVNGLDILVRLARCDLNWPQRAGENTEEMAELVKQQFYDVEFEAEIYRLFRLHPEVLTSNLLYHRAATYRPDTLNRLLPRDVLGRALFVFQKTPGVNNIWPDDAGKRFSLLQDCAHIRAALFSFALSADFVASWLARRPPCPKSIPVDISPTREFAIAFLAAKIDEIIPNDGGLIGWEEDRNAVGPMALRAKKSLLQLLPLIMPPERDPGHFYRLVLDHGDFGIHNMTITDTPTVTSLYDWESGYIVPAILSDPQMAVYVDLVIDGDGVPTISRTWEGITDEDRQDCLRCAEHYFQTLGEQAPQYMEAIKAGKDARRIWFALKSWGGDDSEQYFGALASWAEEKLTQLGSRTSSGCESEQSFRVLATTVVKTQ
ncbi:hypothetical protein B0H19DRAFT_1014234 [Mycena capillaripes]|nr:hypothetical protein B0H19DRAFT_1014234 [Mycena capillaripes]